jgi:hypothetical protein
MCVFSDAQSSSADSDFFGDLEPMLGCSFVADRGAKGTGGLGGLLNSASVPLPIMPTPERAGGSYELEACTMEAGGSVVFNGCDSAATSPVTSAVTSSFTSSDMALNIPWGKWGFETDNRYTSGARFCCNIGGGKRTRSLPGLDECSTIYYCRTFHYYNVDLK